MISKNELKYYSSLLYKKYREKEKKFLLEGTKIVWEGINSGYHAEVVFVTHSYIVDNKQLIKNFSNKKLRVEILKNIEFEKISDTINPQGIAAVLKIPSPSAGIEICTLTSPIVCLENISDPGNVGTIIRNSDWFGIKDLIMSKNCAEVYNPKTIRASMGSVFHLNLFIETDLPATLKKLKQNNFSLNCADLEGYNIFEHKKENKAVLIFSNEANGPGQDLLNIVDKTITIPRLGKAESLNVASASAVILGEYTKSKRM